MKVYAFKNIQHSFSPINTICTNKEVIVCFRRNKTIDFVSKATSTVFLKWELGFIAKKADFLNRKTIVILTDCHKIILFNIETLKSEIFDVNATSICVKFFDAEYSTNNFLFVSRNREVINFEEMKTLFLSKADIKAICTHGRKLIICTSLTQNNSLSDNSVKMISNGIIEKEVNLNEEIVEIIYTENNNFVTIHPDGSATLIDVEIEAKLDSAQIRNSKLNCAVFYQGIIHFSGEDCRIISYLVKDKLIKNCQTTAHFTEVLSMINIENSIYTAGEDSLVIKNDYFGGKYQITRVFDSLINGVVSIKDSSFFYTIGDKKISMYSTNKEFNEEHLDLEMPQSEIFNDSIFSGLDYSEISQTQTDYDYYFKFNTKNEILCGCISSNGKYMAYSSKFYTQLFLLHKDGNLKVEKLKVFEPSVKICFVEDILVFINIDKNIKIFNVSISDFIQNEIRIENFKEFLVSSGDFFVLPVSQKKYFIKRNRNEFVQLEVSHIEFLQREFIQNNFTDQKIISANIFDNQLYLIIFCNNEYFLVSENSIIKIPRSLHLAIPKSMPGDSINSMPGDSIKSIPGDNNLKYIAGDRFINTLDGQKYDFGYVIHGIHFYQNDLLLLQSDWKVALREFKPSIFKEKYSNK